MADIGRISGPLLKDNLVRNGVDLSFETDLLYLDVNDRKIGIKTDSSARELEIADAVQTTNLIVDDLITVASNLEINDQNTISSVLGTLYLNAGQSINASALAVDNIKIDNGRIDSRTADSHLELRPTKGTVVNGNVKIFADLHATGNITFDGDITFGDSNADNVVFTSDIASNLKPNIDLQYSLGSTVDNKRWNTVYAKTLIGKDIFVDNLISADGINYAYKFTNAIFVATGGSNSNTGDHINSPYRNINYALSQATAGDTVYIYPGTYTEIFPLTVPAGVSVVGYDIRTTIIQPTELTKTNDAFLVNGEVTISDLTIKNFYNGYGFRFAPSFTVTSRSPYMQNVTVITRGSVTSETDPLGFDTGDAGKGALVDGGVALSTSKDASMLFQSCTFITPGVDCITMTNGVRVEWLNSFTYFANRGLYATEGLLGFAGELVKYGAEIRSIGSANIYGTYGAVADGASTLMYLINHNFGYIGSGKDSSNDNTVVTQANETVELNSGKIYYTSQSQNGDFRIGDSFFVDFNKGNVSFDTLGIDANGLSTLTIRGTNSVTRLTADEILTSNFRLSGNTIQTVAGAFNFVSADTNIYFDQNVYAAKNIGITGDFNVDGTVTLGNQSQDTVTFYTHLSQDINPKTTGLYDLGSVSPASKIWRDIYLASVNTTNVKISASKIETTLTNGDLTLVGNGTGGVKIEGLYYNNNTITSYTNNSIKLTPNTGKSVVISGTNAVRIPRNTFVLNTTGTLHFNTATNFYEGFNGARVTLGGLYSTDRLTSVLPHPTDNTISFKVNNSTVATISSSGATLNGLLLDNKLTVNSNVFNATTDLTLVADTVNLQSLSIKDNTITAPLNSNIELGTTGQGYVSFPGDKAVVLPYGSDAERPTAPLVGNTRFNTDSGVMEVWDGAIWIPAGGTGELATWEYADEQTTLWSLVIG